LCALSWWRCAGGNWVAAAQDMRGRVYIIDQAGDLYYDSGNPDIGIYAVSDVGLAAGLFEHPPSRGGVVNSGGDGHGLALS
jgi:hypothetical protein